MKLRSNKRLRLVKPVNITKRVKREKSTQLGALLTDEPAPTVAHVGVDVKSAVPIDGALIHVPVDKPRSGMYMIFFLFDSNPFFFTRLVRYTG